MGLWFYCCSVFCCSHLLSFVGSLLPWLPMFMHVGRVGCKLRQNGRQYKTRHKAKSKSDAKGTDMHFRKKQKNRYHARCLMRRGPNQRAPCQRHEACELCFADPKIAPGVRSKGNTSSARQPKSYYRAYTCFATRGNTFVGGGFSWTYWKSTTASPFYAAYGCHFHDSSTIRILRKRR